METIGEDLKRENSPRVDETPKKNKKPSFRRSEGGLDVFPISKGKRILQFLADYFLHFLFAIFIFTLAAFPISRAVVGSDDLQEKTNENTANEISLLVDNSLLYKENGDDGFETSLTYTQKLFAISLLNDSKTNNPFISYYRDVLSYEDDKINELYKEKDSKGFLSDVISQNTGLYTLKESYVTEFSPLLDEKDSLTEQGEKDYSSFSSSFFLPLYNLLISSLSDGSELPEGSELKNYSAYVKSNSDIKDTLDLALTIASYASYVLVWAIIFLLVPLVNSRGKSIGMMAMGINRVGSDNLRLLKKGERALYSVYPLIFDLSFIPFLPLAYISSISNLFDVPALDMVALASLLLVIVSLFVLLFNEYNKTLSDISSRSVNIDNESYDELLKVTEYGRK